MMRVAKGLTVFQMQFAPSNINWSDFLSLPSPIDHLDDPSHLLGRTSFEIDTHFPSSLDEHSPPFDTSLEDTHFTMNSNRIHHESITIYSAPSLLSTLGGGIYGHILTSTWNSPASHTLSLGSEDSNSVEQIIDFDQYILDEPASATCGLSGSSGGTNGTLPSTTPTSAIAMTSTTIINDIKMEDNATVADEPKPQGSSVPQSAQPTQASSTPSTRPASPGPISPNPAGDIQVISTLTKGYIPANAVFCNSDVDRIRKEAQLLARRLRNKGLSSSIRHPYMTCPVFDCARGGWNPLLHGEYPEEMEPPTTGQFFASNEIARHVKSKHAPEDDLRCHHEGCRVQAKLDGRTVDGKGKFCRRDVLRKHYQAYPEHKESVPEELRKKYKLFTS
jgi:hypothetical protein